MDPKAVISAMIESHSDEWFRAFSIEQLYALLVSLMNDPEMAQWVPAYLTESLTRARGGISMAEMLGNLDKEWGSPLGRKEINFDEIIRQAKRTPG